MKKAKANRQRRMQMKLDRNKKVTKEIYREELFDVIEEAEHSRNFIDNNVS